MSRQRKNHTPAPPPADSAEEHRLQQLGRVAGYIAHELNNLMTPVVSYAELSRAHPEDEELRGKALGIALRNCAQAGRMAAAVLDLARAGAFHVEHSKPLHAPIAVLSVAIRTAVAAIGRPLESDRITLTTPKEDFALAMPQVLLDQVLMNLLLNARAAMSRGGSIEISGSRRGSLVSLVVEDTGPGLVESSRGAAHGGGRGIGLSFCSRVVEEFGGKFLVESGQDRGVRVTIVAPAASVPRELAA